jgi:hypothetical protein
MPRTGGDRYYTSHAITIQVHVRATTPVSAPFLGAFFCP